MVGIGESAESRKSAEAAARLDVDDLSRRVPSPVWPQFREHVKEQILRFRITPPRGGVTKNRFDGPLYELACDLAKQVDGSAKKRTVVRGCVERVSRRRYPLSDRIEEALRDGLTVTKQLTVLRPSISGNASASLDPEVEVSGHYELCPDHLCVHATVTRLSDRGVEATSRTTIPRTVLPKTDVSSLLRGME